MIMVLSSSAEADYHDCIQYIFESGMVGISCGVLDDVQDLDLWLVSPGEVELSVCLGRKIIDNNMKKQ